MIPGSYCIGITLFNPTQKQINMVKEYTKIFSKVYVYDNSINSLFLEIENVEYFYNGKNDGISIAFNYIANKAFVDKFEYILFMDQDSVFKYEEINKIITTINQSKDEIALIGPQIFYSTEYKMNDAIKNKIKEESWIITSGSFCKLSVFNSLKGYDENYFIDRVDKDYCKRLSLSGYKIYIYEGSIMEQELGDKTFTFLKFMYSTHSPLRNYYISRNRLYYNKKFSISKIRTLFQTFKQILLIIIFDDNKKKKLKFVTRGILDFRKNKMGQYRNRS